MSVIIETQTTDKTEWGVSFTSHNPEPRDYVECASYEDAERLHDHLTRLEKELAEQKGGCSE